MSILNKNLQFHIKTNPAQIGRYVITPGDPGRVPLIAERLENAVQVACNREYNTYTGELDGEKVSVVSTGIGGPSAAIAVEELIRCGADTFIRVGTSGGMDLAVTGGDLIVAQAAIRGDGTSQEYLPPHYPAVADFAVTKALAEAAEQLSQDEDGKRFHVGVVQSKDSFYGEVEPETMPIAAFLEQRWESFLRCGCLASEMEAATIYAVAMTRGVRAGAVLTALWNVERSKAGLPDRHTENSDRAITCAVNAIRRLIKIDNN
ncbi:MAG: uridine phosphorylase [Oscillospiraceae bacterium]|nr:uridine phosphorylase [Oscillospiraceae bacterium]